MDTRQRGRFVAAALAGILLIAGTADRVAAKKPKSFYSAIVNGKKLKAHKKVLIAQYSTVAVALSGGPKPRPTKSSVPSASSAPST